MINKINNINNSRAPTPMITYNIRFASSVGPGVAVVMDGAVAVRNIIDKKRLLTYRYSIVFFVWLVYVLIRITCPNY